MILPGQTPQVYRFVRHASELESLVPRRLSVNRPNDIVGLRMYNFGMFELHSRGFNVSVRAGRRFLGNGRESCPIVIALLIIAAGEDSAATCLLGIILMLPIENEAPPGITAIAASGVSMGSSAAHPSCEVNTCFACIPNYVAAPGSSYGHFQSGWHQLGVEFIQSGVNMGKLWPKTCGNPPDPSMSMA